MGLFLSIFLGIVTAYLVITHFEETIAMLGIMFYYFLVGIFWIVPPIVIFSIIQVWSVSMLILSFLIWIVIVKSWPRIEKIFTFDLFSPPRKSKT